MITVDGDAGTGKSVLLSYLFNTIQNLASDEASDLKGTNNFLLVINGEMIKTYENIAKNLPNLKRKQIQKPTSLINKLEKGDEKADIVLIDEAHLLLTKEIILNSINVLIKRGVHGLYIYTTDLYLRKKLINLKEETKDDEY